MCVPHVGVIEAYSMAHPHQNGRGDAGNIGCIEGDGGDTVTIKSVCTVRNRMVGRE